jgi:hypothetical protein
VSPAPPPRFTSPQAASRHLLDKYGVSVHFNTIVRWTKEGLVPGFQPRPSGWWKIDLEELDAFFEKRLSGVGHDG